MKTVSALVLSLVCVASPAWAADVAVFPVRGTNLSPEEIGAIGAVIAHEYAKASGRDVLAPPDTVAALDKGGSPAAAAQELKVAEYVDTTVVRLKKKMLVETSLRSSSGVLLHSARMTALTLDDMAEVGDRLAQALVQRKSVEETLTLESVTKVEGTTKNKVATHKVLGVKTSFAKPMGTPAPVKEYDWKTNTEKEVARQGYEPFASIGFDARLEGKRHFVEFGAGALIPAETSTARAEYGGLYAEFGGAYYLLDGTASPYLGGGVMPRLILSSGSDGINMAPYLQAGVMMMRESRTRLYAELRVAQNVLPIQEEYPTEVGLQFGIGF